MAFRKKGDHRNFPVSARRHLMRRKKGLRLDNLGGGNDEDSRWELTPQISAGRLQGYLSCRSNYHSMMFELWFDECKFPKGVKLGIMKLCLEYALCEVCEPFMLF